MTHDRKWDAIWICDPDFTGLQPRDLFHKQLSPAKELPPHREDLLDRHMLVRKEFTLDRTPEAPFIDISADDFYRLYVNGRFIAEGPANSYHFRYRYDRIDLSDALVEGVNAIAVHVFYQGLVNRVWISGDYRQGLIAEIFNGGRCVLATDSSWRICVPKTVPGARFGYDTQFAENIDARLWPDPSWRSAGFDDSSWSRPAEKRDDGHVLVRSEIPPVARRVLQPVSSTELEEGLTVYDFGSETVGHFTCEAYGRPGDTIQIRHGEELSPDGSVRILRCNCDYTETWTLAGRNPDRLEYCDYKAFRYVELKAPAGVRVVGVEVFERSYPHGDGAALQSDDKLLQGIWDICARGVRLGAQGAFLDCPSREKGQYLGDMTVSANAHLHLSGDPRLFKKALVDFADSAFICPGLMAVSPSALMQEIADYSLQYPLQLLLYYNYTGDLKTVEALFPAAEGMMEYFRKHERADGLIENVLDKWNLVDWPENLRDGYDFNLDSKGAGKGVHAVLNAFYGAALSAMGSLRRILGKPAPDAFPRMRTAFIKSFYRKSSGLFVDSESSSHSSLHSNALALYAGLVPEEAVGQVVEFIAKKGFSCGVYMAYFVLKALARAQRHDLLYKLMTNESERSWANMLREDATSCFEAWGKEQKWNTSLCHPWAAAPIPLFVEDIVGVHPMEPGYAAIGVSPHLRASYPDFKLELSVPSARLSFIKDGGTLHVEACAKDAVVSLSVDGAVRVDLRPDVPAELDIALAV